MQKHKHITDAKLFKLSPTKITDIFYIVIEMHRFKAQ